MNLEQALEVAKREPAPSYVFVRYGDEYRVCAPNDVDLGTKYWRPRELIEEFDQT